MSRKTYGILVGILGSAVGAWLYRNRLAKSSVSGTMPRPRGEVIFDNTPVASDSTAF
jgi:hypothetical protein